MPEEIRDMMNVFQQYQQQLQSVMLQKENIKMQITETDKAMKELDNSKDDVYKATGSILIKVKSNEIKKDLKEDKETLDIKLKSLAKQEDILKKKLTELQTKIQQGLQKSKNVASS